MREIMRARWVTAAACLLLAGAAGAGFAVAQTASTTLSVDGTGLTWTDVPGVTGYGVIRGDIGTLRQTHGDFSQATRACLYDGFNGGTATSLAYKGVPKVGEAFFFLVRATTAADPGLYAEGGAGQAGTPDAGIEQSAVACFSPVTPHNRIVIDSDSHFDANRGVLSGSGTAADPYLIAGWDIDCADKANTVGIEIDNTTAAFLIRNVRITACARGMVLDHASNGTIQRSWIGARLQALAITGGDALTLEENQLASDATGLVIDGAAATVRRNGIGGTNLGIDLQNAPPVELYGNNIQGATPASDPNGGATWNHPYPEGGNFWNDLNSVDRCAGPNQDICAPGYYSDGIADSPHDIWNSGEVRDQYPKMGWVDDEGDTLPPTVSFIAPVNGAVQSTPGLTLEAQADDNQAGTMTGVEHVDFRLNGGPWTQTSPPGWSLAVTLVPGSNRVEARAIDRAGNLSPVVSSTVTYQGTVVWQSHLEIPQASYPVGASIPATLHVTNTSQFTGTLNFPTTCEAYFIVRNASGTIVYDQRKYLFCFDTFVTRTVAPGATVDYPFSWTQVDDLGAAVPPGSYTITGSLTSYETVPAASAGVSIAPIVWQSQLEIPQASYPVGASVPATLLVTNASPFTGTLNFPTTCEADFIVRNASGTSVYDQLNHVGCFDVFVTRTVAAGATVSYPFTWTQVDDGGAAVPPGDYTVNGSLTCYETVPAASAGVSITP